MVHMARAYLAEKQMPRSFWFYAIVHSARMMNAIPGKFGGKLASPFLLVHGSGHDERTWFPLFSVCYFHHVRDGDIPCSHCQLHTLDGIAIGRSPTSNALLVYNPRTKRYYEPDSYRLDPYRLPSSVYPSLKYDGGSFALSCGMRMCRWKNPFLRALVSSVWTRPLTCFSRARLWTSHSLWILWALHLIRSCSTMALRLLFHFQRWLRLSQRLLFRVWFPRIRLTMVRQLFFLLSSWLTVGSLMNTTVLITKGSSLASLAVCIGSVLKPM